MLYLLKNDQARTIWISHVHKKTDQVIEERATNTGTNRLELSLLKQFLLLIEGEELYQRATARSKEGRELREAILANIIMRICMSDRWTIMPIIKAQIPERDILTSLDL